jgi:hypothetical protein
MGHGGTGCAIETKAIANIANPPRPAGKPGEGPPLAEIRETPRLLHDLAASGGRVVIEVGLQAAELIHDVVDLAV